MTVHAGGVVWHGDYLHVAATARGFMTVPARRHRADAAGDVTAGPDRVGVDGARAAFGYRYVLPVRFGYEAVTPARAPTELRYSFLSLDRSTPPHRAGRRRVRPADQSTRLARFAIDPATSLLRDRG